MVSTADKKYNRVYQPTPQPIRPVQSRVQQSANRYVVTGNVAVEVEEEELPRVAPRPRTHPVPKPRAKVERGFARRFMMVACVVGALALVLPLMYRYALIADRYSDINEVKAQIKSANITLDELSVAVECEIDLDKLKQIAQENGLDYPTSDQVVVMDGSSGAN